MGPPGKNEGRDTSESSSVHLHFDEPAEHHQLHRHESNVQNAENILPVSAHHAVDIRSLHSGNPNDVVAENIPRQAWKQLLGKNPFKTSYFALYRPLKSWQDWSILAGAIVLSLAAGVPLPIIGVLFGKMINGFPPDPHDLNVRLGQLMGVAVAYFAITWGWATCWGMIGERVSRGLREEVLEKAIGMDIGWFEVEGADIAQRLTADTQTIQLGTSEKAGLFIQAIAYFIAAFATGFILNARLTGILFVAVIPAMALVVCIGSSVVSKYAKSATEASQKGSAVAEGAITAVRVVQAFGALDRLTHEYLGFLGDAVRLGIIKSIAGAVMLGSVYFVAYSANALAFWEGSRLIAAGKGEGAGTVYTVVFLILDASFVIGSFGPFLQTFALAAAAGEKIMEILDKPAPEIDVYSDSGDPAPSGPQDITIENVTFVYPARPTVRVLDGVSLLFPAGKVTAIVGPSGSGKSTIVGLALRFYDPTFGVVKFGGSDVKELNLSSLRSKIALVNQDPTLFSGTILENIKHGLLCRPELLQEGEERIRERCIQAAKDANAYDFINALPNGFDTVVGGGSATQLSGGQKQRISIARALVKDPSILILDEPTSALDATSEAVILEVLERAQANAHRTVIMIAHRLATVRNADKIVVMAHGKAVEEGTHESLISQGGAYADLVAAQDLGGEESSSASSVVTKVEEGADQIEVVEDGLKSKEKDVLAEAGIVVKGKSSAYSSGQLIKRCLALSRPDAFWIVLGLCASICSGGIVIGESIVFGNLIATLNTRTDLNKMTSDAAFFSLMFFVLALIALGAFITSGSSFGIVSERLIRRVREKSMRTILRQDAEWFTASEHSPAALMSMLNMDAGHLSGLSGVIIGTVFSVLTSMIGGIVLAHVVAWKVAVVLLAAVPVMLFSGFMRLRILSKFEQRHQTAYLKAAALATEACTSIRTVAALGRERDITRLYKLEVEKPYKESLGFIVYGNLWLAFALAITYFVYALAYYWGARQVREGFCTQLEFFIVLPALLFSAQASGQMFSLAPEVTRAKTAAASIFKLHDEKPEIDLGSTSGPSNTLNDKSGSLPPPPPNGSSIEFRNIDFAYASRPDTLALRKFNLKITPGAFYAFVGPSGAGKSSAVALLERFYDPNSGAVLVDGEDIRNVPVAEHRKRLSLVSQEPCLFPGSILFNVGLGKVDGNPATQEEVEAVCKACGLHEFIMSLPEGYHTDCGSNGSHLSGGQKQRISIARALMRNPSVLILDEATSALDSHSEKLVQDAIAKASRGRTSVVVAHRLSSIMRADCICVFEGGRVVEMGRHEELIKLGGIYAGMVRRQEVGAGSGSS